MGFLKGHPFRFDCARVPGLRAGGLLILLAAFGGAPSSAASLRPLPLDYATRKAVAYSPFRRANRDAETITAAMVKQDLDLLVAGDFRLIRLFDSSDQVARLVLQVIHDHTLDLKVQLGISISANHGFNRAEIARAIAQPVTTDDNWAFFASAPSEVLKTLDFVSLHSYPLLDSIHDPTS